MSVELQHAREPGRNNASLQGTTLGGSKPLHRFMQGQPKITGIVVLILGSSFFIRCASMMSVLYSSSHTTAFQPGFVPAILYIVCGSVYIVTEIKPTKKTVTVSLALSIVSLLVSCWIVFLYLPSIIFYLQRVHLDEDIFEADIMPETDIEHLAMATVQISVLHTGVGGIIFIVMSFLAGAALRSTKSKAVVVMTATLAEPPVE